MTWLGSALPDLRVRDRRAELMDDPDLDPERHRLALEALSRVNAVSLGAWRLWREVADVHRRSGEPVRVLDVACGGGDVVHAVGRRARRAGVPVVLHGCDLSERALAEARAGPDPTVRFFELDALREPIPEAYDVVTSSLFLHHLTEADAVALLRRMAEASLRRLFVQDLRRTRLGYVVARVGLHTLTRSDVARIDGLRSVRAAFTIAEARALCARAGLADAVVSTGWPQRLVLRWDRRRTA